MKNESSSGSEEMEDAPFTVAGGRWRMNQEVAVGRWRMDHLQWQVGDGGWTIYSSRWEMEDRPFTVAGGRWRMDHLQ